MPWIPRLVWALVGLVSLVLCALPLFNLLGYESAAVVGVVAGLGALVLTWHAIESGRIRAPLDPARTRSVSADYFALLPKHLGLVAVPALILGINALRVKNCDPLLGARFFVVLPLVSVVVGQTIAFAAALLPWRRARLPLALAIVLFEAVLLGLRLKDHPPIQGYSWLVGWFAGSIYDEALNLPRPLLWYRLTVLAEMGTLLLGLESLWRWKAAKNHRGVWAGLVVVGALMLGLEHKHADRGWDIGREDIAQVLSQTIETEHFRIHIQPGSLDAERVALLAQDHEFRFAELTAWTGVDPVAVHGDRLDSWIYPDAKTQGRLFGSRGTFVARPWTWAMHLRWDGYGDATLAHEMAHLVSAPFGGGPFKMATQDGIWVHIGLVEGFALAADWPPRELNPHEAAAAMRDLDIAPNLRRLFRPDGFWSQPGGKAYTLMGSFVRWLWDTHGAEKFRTVYQNGDWKGVYGKGAPKLVGEWEAFIDTIPVDDRARQITRQRYDKKSIFEKVCARTMAELRRKAGAAEGRGDYVEAVRLRRQIQDFQPSRAAHAIALARLMAKQDDFEGAQAELAAVGDPAELNPERRAELLQLRGDLAWRLGQRDAADADYAAVMQLGLPDGDMRLLGAKRAALSETDPAMVAVLRRYLLEGENSAVRLHLARTWADARPNEPLAWYLVGYRLYQLSQWTDAAAWLEGPPGLLPQVHMDEQRRLVRAQSLLHLDRLDEAQAEYQGLLDAESGRSRTRAAEGLRRVIWRRTGNVEFDPLSAPER